MEGITKVLQRINAVEQRFKFSTVSNQQVSFAECLDTAAQSTSQPEYNFATNDIARIINFTAQKYGVDPKLAMAIAKTESNLSPDAVSSVGAVGVMQLMPQTAQGLGVKNISDPRDNIDGGVRYLKQLLNDFNGDVVKSVAAYNAGPNAVKKYNGVPPYAETQNYVAKVMAYCR